ncbi:uncharacterized protein TrAFT101_009973 [Trichoderma asperellum]|uniref:Uncharacterized protein n=1 Tax=Trichoderma asperellum (strain ATCC 204424 / CBS 433.97 / NBRC 101777) TaxID=1042311 RepID=A0A2T3Z9G0_TRIA4|nr:hypothetical protein M441DRAFT_26634 [Trichoderma asperellum CBS 433.97]PTB41420.1 hypothetical protein M441DRAFT_26634 [Trichoderma asperellum CBS 433.97]UKZ95120.1 hypothetical protein TrAFT101_009973 [Trichoderma asperellum]
MISTDDTETKRKQVIDDENVYPHKKVFMEENAVEGDLEVEVDGDPTTDSDDDYDLLRTDTPHLAPTPCEFSAQNLALAKESVDKIVAKACSALEKSAITNLDADTLSSDTCSSTTLTEAGDDDHVPDEGIRNRRQGHRSLNLEEMPPHANAFTGALPGDRGHRSSPPNLDATWTMTSHFEFFPSVSELSAKDLDGLTEGWFAWHCLSSYSEGRFESESESRSDGPQ